jgi:hypothetical protein
VVSGHNLESSQTLGFYLSFLPFYKVLFMNKLEFFSSSSLSFFSLVPASLAKGGEQGANGGGGGGGV